MERVLNRPPAGSKPRTVKLKDMPVEERADRCQEDHMMWKCAYLSIMPNPDGSFTVWGGDSQHHVTIENGKAHCDCRGWLQPATIIAVML